MPFSAIEAKGGRVTRARRRHGASVQLAGVVLATSDLEVTEVTVVLPRPAAARFVFTRESLRSALGKLVWGELVLGDPAFDDVVLARTETPEATRALLHDGALREFVVAVVAADGALSVDGDRVTAVIPDGAGVGDLDVAAFVDRLWPSPLVR